MEGIKLTGHCTLSKIMAGKTNVFIKTAIKATSVEAASSSGAPFDFIFIDGDHSYERCYEDLNLWYDRIRPGGLFSGHDFSLPGVNKALLQFRTERNIKGFFKVIPNDVWFWIKD